MKLTFGVIPSHNQPEQPIQPVVRKVEEPVFSRQDIIGTLTLKKTPLGEVRPLSPDYLERLQKNLKKIYLAGITSSGRSVIDFQEGELKVSFPYEQAAVERMKGLDRNERAWDPDQKNWRVFIGTFDDVFDILGRGFKLSEVAYNAILDFIISPYYAFVAG